MTLLRSFLAVMRMLWLIVLGVPAFCNWPMSLVPADKPFLMLAAWLLYVCLIEVTVTSFFGINRLTEWTLLAAVIAISVVMPQLLFTQLFDKLADWGLMEPGRVNKTDSTILLVKQFISMLAVIPYGALVINSVPVSRWLDSASALRGRTRIFAQHVCLIMRVVQHIFECIPPLILVWREEYPKLVAPRHRGDIQGLWSHFAAAGGWVVSAARLWALAALVFAFEPIAMFCHEIESLYRAD